MICCRLKERAFFFYHVCSSNRQTRVDRAFVIAAENVFLLWFGGIHALTHHWNGRATASIRSHVRDVQVSSNSCESDANAVNSALGTTFSCVSTRVHTPINQWRQHCSS